MDYTDSEMPKNVTELNALQRRYEADLLKPVTLSAQLRVDYVPLQVVPHIQLKFKVGGGWQQMVEYEVVGGLDNGSKVTCYPWVPKPQIDPQAKIYNGTRQEFESYLGYTARPGIGNVWNVRGESGTLHISTVMYLAGFLKHQQEKRSSEAVAYMHEYLLQFCK